uniref:PARP catalytic domain-containing protein n=1 Tax=Macrostomum lignano TaxID=282301 RepID=A0A1I8JQJ4_9PLAT
MYILGNADCLAGCQEHQLWRRLIQSMTEVGCCLGPRLALVCPRHRDATPAPRREVTDANEGFPTSLDFCDRLCDAFMDCGQHKCQKLCRSPGIRIRIARSWWTFCSVQRLLASGTAKCNEDPADLLCQARVSVSCPKCQQSDTKPCHQPMSDYSCPQPCPKRLSCGHACPEKCGDPCPANPAKDCRTCLEAERLRKEALKTAGRGDAKSGPRGRPRTSTRGSSRTRRRSSEFFDIQDRVTKYVQMTHGWFPKVRSVERLRNVKLRMRFLSYRQNTARMPAGGLPSLPQNPGMFGAGIYFASDASKSAQELYTKGSRTLLLCEVLLGRSLRVTEATNSKYNWKSLRQENYDSIFAPRDTKNSGGVLFDEFVFKAKYGADHQYAQYVLAFHGTKTAAIVDDIMANNFDLKKLQRCAHGFGVYLSEFADVSVGYGTEMLLCRVLPGNPQEGCGGNQRIDPNYNSI